MINFCAFDENFLELSWKWLNDSEVKKMTNTPDFFKEDQYKWFLSLENNKNYYIWGIEFENKPIGVAGLKNVTEKDAFVYWYIGEKSDRGKGYGNYIASEITKKAKSLGLEFLYAFSIIENYKSINLLFKEGYKISKFENGKYTLFKKL